MNKSYAQYQNIIVNPSNWSKTIPSLAIFFNLIYTMEIHKMKNGSELNMNTGTISVKAYAIQGKRKVSLIKIQKNPFK